ncbi:MAG: sialate O-acetylesterase [Opitutaceae bacterium]
MNIIQGLAEGQVLQRIGNRGATVRVIGDSVETGPVFATITGPRGALKGWKERRVGASSRGKFSAVLAGIPAGGPYRLVLRCAKAQARVKAFYSGDVWLMAGQSNMEGVGDMTSPAKPHPLIRTFSMRREWRLATDPLHVLGESPDFCHSGARQLSPEQGEAIRRTAKKGVGVGVFFGREMFARSGVPQGLIATAHGGTSMAQWDPALKDEGGASQYGSMILSMRATGQPVAGVLWYQGESDSDGVPLEVYTEKMRGLVAAVRRDLKQPALPWLMVQIATVFGQWGGPGWNRMQEQQRLLPSKIKNLETVSAVDLPLDDNIHISATAFPVLAARLARAADRLVYGNRREAPMPAFKTIIAPHPKKSPGHIDVVFTNVPGGLRSEGAPRGFALVDSDGREVPSIFKTTLHGNIARLHFQQGLILPWGTRLAYGHGRMPVCTITDGRGCALPAFGPRSFLRPNALMPFCTTWRVSRIVAAPVAPLGELARPDPEAHGAETRTYNVDGFINEHPRWQKASGHGYFSAKLTLPEPMKLGFMLGYDGPFRMWIGDEDFYNGLDGVNPCIPDEFSKTVSLPAGVHTLTVAMDLNHGVSWGFFLRLRRCDLSAAEIRKGAFARPVYSI